MQPFNDDVVKTLHEAFEVAEASHVNAHKMAKYMHITHEMTKANADKIAVEEPLNVEAINSNQIAVDTTLKMASHALMLAKYTDATMQLIQKLCDIY